MADTCSTCRYFAPGKPTGLCHRYPMQIVKLPSQWCGEYKAPKQKPGRKPKNARVEGAEE